MAYELFKPLWADKRPFLVAFANLRKATVSFVMSLRPYGTTRVRLDGFLWNLILCFSKMWRKFECHYNPTRITGSLHEDLCVFMAVSRWILLKMRNVSAKRCREKSKHILCSITFFRKSCRLWDNVEKYGEDDEDTDNIIRRMRCVCWITNATNTHSGGTRWRSWLRHCATNWKVAGSIPDGVTGIFQWLNPSCRIVALGSTQPVTEVSTRDLSWG